MESRFDLPRMMAGLSDSDPDTRFSAVAAVEEWLKELLEAGMQDEEIHQLLVHKYPDLLPALVRALGDPHKGVQVTSASCLQFLAYQSPTVIPALREAMAGTPWRAWGAAIVCARLNLWFPEMAGALTGALGSHNRDVRWAAANMCLQLGRTYPEAVAAVTQALQNENPITRKMAAYCLGAMGEYASVEAHLVAALKDEERDVKRAVLLALDKLPVLAPETVDRIAAFRQDPDEYLQRTAKAVAGKRGRP